MYKLTVTGTLEIDEHDAEILDALQGKHGETNQYEVAMQELSEACKDVKVVLTKEGTAMSYAKGEQLGNYDCGCHIHKDSEDFYVIDWCPKHKAVDDIYEALKFFVSRVSIMGQFTPEKQGELRQALAKAKSA